MVFGKSPLVILPSLVASHTRAPRKLLYSTNLRGHERHKESKFIIKKCFLAYLVITVRAIIEKSVSTDEPPGSPIYNGLDCDSK